jgi:hypothetical protein
VRRTGLRPAAERRYFAIILRPQLIDSQKPSPQVSDLWIQPRQRRRVMITTAQSCPSKPSVIWRVTAVTGVTSEITAGRLWNRKRQPRPTTKQGSATSRNRRRLILDTNALRIGQVVLTSSSSGRSIYNIFSIAFFDY